MVNGRLQRGTPSDPAFNPRTGAGYVAPFPGDYARAQKAGALLVEPSGACGPRLAEQAAEGRSNKLTSSEYDETIGVRGVGATGGDPQGFSVDHRVRAYVPTRRRHAGARQFFAPNNVCVYGIVLLVCACIV